MAEASSAAAKAPAAAAPGWLGAERPIVLTARVDASYQAATGVTGIGIVLQATNRPRRRGPIIAEIFEAYDGVPPGVIELLAVFRALEIARDRGFERVKVRSDYNSMRRQLKHHHAEGLTANPRTLQGRTLALARAFVNVVFAYQPRRKNGMAHQLARRATKELQPASRPELFP